MKNVDVGWGIVSACNMKCKFCYSADVRQEIRNANVGIKDWISFVDRNSENIDSINYGTGENSLLDIGTSLLAMCLRIIQISNKLSLRMELCMK